LGIGWREVLGLLVGLAICYGVISYAATNAPQNRETASEQTESEPERSTTERQQPAPAPPSPGGDTKTVTIRVTGYGGEPFSGEVVTLDSRHPVAGHVLTDYELEVRTGYPSADTVLATIQKTANDNNVLIVQVLDDGKVLKGESTNAPYGVVRLVWSTDEQ